MVRRRTVAGMIDVKPGGNGERTERRVEERRGRAGKMTVVRKAMLPFYPE